MPDLPRSYAIPPGGHPGQGDLLTGRAVFTEAYAVLPAGVLRDIVTSRLPGWTGTRAWVLARPMTGFAETFSQMILELAPGGGTERAETDTGVQGALFVVDGSVTLHRPDAVHRLDPGGFAYLPPDAAWGLANAGETPARLHWFRKVWEPAPGLTPPEAFVTADAAIAPDPMPGTEGRWSTTRFMDSDDLRHDMHVTVVTLAAGASIPFLETHVMEHGLYVLQGKGVYRLNRDWVEVEAGDFMWLRAFCPQACYAGGPEPFRYLLYKDVNRLPRMRPFG
jgi:(S)-ureidoglycine aminohydrolase